MSATKERENKLADDSARSTWRYLVHIQAWLLGNAPSLHVAGVIALHLRVLR